MRMVSLGASRWRGIVIGALLVSLIPLTAAALTRLDEPDQPVLALDMDGLLTAPGEPLGASLSHFLPKPKPKLIRQPTRLPEVSGGGVWDRLAQCESGGNWHHTGSRFSGGLQFLPSTWRAAGGIRYAPTAAQATREQQITIAQSWLARTSWSQWPACSRRLGLR